MMNERIHIDEDVEDHSEWIGSLEQLGDWLNEHPKAEATIGRWCLFIESPDPDDIIELCQFEPPSELTSSVEDFHTSKNKSGKYNAYWRFC